MQYNEVPSSDAVVYFPPKEGSTFQDVVQGTHNFHDCYIVGTGAYGTVYKAVML